MLQIVRLVSIISVVNPGNFFVFWKPGRDDVKPILADTFLVVTLQGTAQKNTGDTPVPPRN